MTARHRTPRRRASGVVRSALGGLVLCLVLGAAGSLGPLGLGTAGAQAPATAGAQAGTQPRLQVTDPAGDALGDGSAQLPQEPRITEAMLDLRAFEVWPGPQGTEFRVTFTELGNPWHASSGFSAQTLDIFVQTRPGGAQELADLHLRAENGGWQHHLRVSAGGAVWSVPQGPADDPSGGAADGVPALSDPVVRVSGRTLVIQTDLPPGDYAYWVTSSVYSPFSAGGVLRPGVGSGPFSVQVNALAGEAPVPLDVLEPGGDLRPYNVGLLPAAGKVKDPRPATLLGSGLLGLVLAGMATRSLWAARPRGRAPRLRPPARHPGS